MDWQNILALAGAITGFIGLAASWMTSRSSARKNDVDSLSTIIKVLEGEIDRLKKENSELREQMEEGMGLLQAQVEILEGENASLRGRVDTLEKENHTLRNDNIALAAAVGKQAQQAKEVSDAG